MRAHLASLVEEFRHHADETAIVTHVGVRRYPTSYGELAFLAGRFSAELDRRGIRPGDRVVLWGANSAEWVGAFFGCLLRGVIAVPLDAAGSPEFALRVVVDVRPRFIVGDRELFDSMLEGAEKVPFLSMSGLHESLPTEANFAVSPEVTAQSPFQIVFTSGTTSEPKGIVHTHANVLASVAPIEREMAKYRRYERIFHPLRFLQTLPLSHVFGQFMGLWLPPLLASEVHFADQLESRRMVDLVRRERISVLVAVPRVLQLLRSHLAGRFEGLEEQIEGSTKRNLVKQWWKFRRVHNALGWKFWAVISGGAALPSEMEQFWIRLGVAVIQGYGMTETTALVTLNHPFKIGHGTIGKTLPGREVKLSDEGEILVRGDMLASATWAGGQIRPREGEWLATGDLATRNEAGELRFLGRKGDVIVTASGMNIHPDDLEAAMKRQPGIRDCVVVPCQTLAGPEPVVVALWAGSEAELQGAVVAANRNLADFQQIRRALKWPEPQFPHTSTGKLLRRKVTDWVCQSVENRQNGHRPGRNGQAASQSSPRSSLTGEEILIEVIAEISGETPVGSAAELRLAEDLHLDSLGRVQLQTALEERLGIELPDDALASVETLGELRAALAPAGVTAAGDGTGVASATTALEPPVAAQRARQSEQEAYRSEGFYPKWPWAWPVVAFRVGFLELVIRPLAWLLAGPRVANLAGELPPGPVIVVANHVSAYDGALILYALPWKLRRRLAIAMSGELLLNLREGRKQSNWLMNLVAPLQYLLAVGLFNIFPLPQLHGFRRSFAHAGEAMDRGYSALVFPEGARHQDGQLHSFRQGIGLLVEETRAAVLPVALIGLDKMRSGGWFRSGELEIRIGRAIPAEETKNSVERTQEIEDAVHSLGFSG